MANPALDPFSSALRVLGYLAGDKMLRFSQLAELFLDDGGNRDDCTAGVKAALKLSWIWHLPIPAISMDDGPLGVPTPRIKTPQHFFITQSGKLVIGLPEFFARSPLEGFRDYMGRDVTDPEWNPGEKPPPDVPGFDDDRGDGRDDDQEPANGHDEPDDGDNEPGDRHPGFDGPGGQSGTMTTHGLYNPTR